MVKRPHRLTILSFHRGAGPVGPVRRRGGRPARYGFLRDGYRDVEVFSVNLFRFEQLMMRMATEGAWRPAFEFLSEAIARQTGIRDYISGEKVFRGSSPPI